MSLDSSRAPSITLPAADRTYVEYRNMFENRLRGVTSDLAAMFDALSDDPVTKAMADDEASAKYIQERCAEVVEEVLKSDEERTILQLEKELVNQRMEMDQLHPKVIESSQLLEKFEQTHSQQQEEMESLRRQVGDMESLKEKSRQLSFEILDLREELSGKNDKLTKFIRSNAEKDSKATQLRADLEEAEGRLHDVKRNSSRMEKWGSERSTFKHKIRILETKLEQFDERNTNIHNSFFGVCEDIEEITRDKDRSLMSKVKAILNKLLGGNGIIIDSIVHTDMEIPREEIAMIQHRMIELLHDIDSELSTISSEDHEKRVKELENELKNKNDLVKKLQQKLVKYRDRVVRQEDEDGPLSAKLISMFEKEMKNKEEQTTLHGFLDELKSHMSKTRYEEMGYISRSEHDRTIQIEMRELEAKYLKETKEMLAEYDSDARKKCQTIDKRKEDEVNRVMESTEEQMRSMQKIVDEEQRRRREIEELLEEEKNRRLKEEHNKILLVGHLEDATVNLDHLKQELEEERIQMGNLQSSLRISEATVQDEISQRRQIENEMRQLNDTCRQEANKSVILSDELSSREKNMKSIQEEREKTHHDFSMALSELQEDTLKERQKYIAQIDELRKSVHDLRINLEKAESEKSIADRRASQLSKSVDDLKSACEEIREKAAKSDEWYSKKVQEMELNTETQVSSANRRYVSEISDLKDELSVDRRKLEMGEFLRRRYARNVETVLRERVVNYHRELNSVKRECQKQITSVQHEMERVISRIGVAYGRSLSDQASGYEEKIHYLRGQLTHEFESRYKEYEDDKVDTLMRLENELSTLREELFTVQKENQTLKRSLKSSERNIEKKESQVRKLSDSRDKMFEELQELKSAVTRQENEHREITKDEEALRNRNDALEKENLSLNERIAAIRSVISSLSALIPLPSDVVSGLFHEKVLNIERVSRRLIEVIDNYSQKKAEEGRSASDSEVNQLRNKLLEMNDMRERLEDEVLHLRGSLKENDAQYHASSREGERRIREESENEYKNELRKVYKEVDDLQQKYQQDLEQKAADANAVIESLERKHEEAVIKLKNGFEKDFRALRSESGKTNSHLVQERKHLQMECDNLQVKVEEISAAYEKLRAEEEDKGMNEAQLVSLRQQLDEKDRRIVSLEKSRSKYSERLAKKQEHVQALKILLEKSLQTTEGAHDTLSQARMLDEESSKLANEAEMMSHGRRPPRKKLDRSSTVAVMRKSNLL